MGRQKQTNRQLPGVSDSDLRCWVSRLGCQLTLLHEELQLDTNEHRVSLHRACKRRREHARQALKRKKKKEHIDINHIQEGIIAGEKGHVHKECGPHQY
jgi:hypothetical protein